ncbi:hypothetical protein HanPSC8_Chr15g0677001 [Helianthus annuus]|nr:hypothetical protein HanPSC8_Chr15g0677001 [Helianthus annuus]
MVSVFEKLMVSFDMYFFQLLLQRKKNYLTQKSLMSLEMESQQATEFIPELEFTFTYPF